MHMYVHLGTGGHIKSNYRAAGCFAAPGLCWSDFSLLLEEMQQLCAWNHSSFTSYLSTATTPSTFSLNNCICGFEIQLVYRPQKSAWMEVKFKSQCIVRLETSRWHSRAARQRAGASQVLWECLTISTEQAAAKQLRLQGSVTDWGAGLTPRLTL